MDFNCLKFCKIQFFISFLIISAVYADTVSPLEIRALEFKARFKLNNVNDKLVDNYGNGYLALYGTRNLRTVLYGVQYRGGGNNVNHATSPRSNRNPLPEDGLLNLCQEGFQNAVYLYSDNFQTASKIIHCVLKDGTQNVLQYLQISPYNDGQKTILTLIYNNILDEKAKPIYTHCWNGWHASGFISALSLRQFCNVSPEDAVQYWNRNTDQNDHEPAFEKIRDQIRTFVPDPSMTLDLKTRELICPQLI